MPIFERPMLSSDTGLARSMPDGLHRDRDPASLNINSFESIPTNDITSISFILSHPISVYRFKNLVYIETFIARFLYSRI
jgi:hypothetical protein